MLIDGSIILNRVNRVNVHDTIVRRYLAMRIYVGIFQQSTEEEKRLIGEKNSKAAKRFNPQYGKGRQ